MSGELRNIPFYWTACAHWLPCLCFCLYYEKRERWGCAAKSVAFLPVLTLYMFYAAPLDGLPFNLAMAGFALLTLLHFRLVSGMGTAYTVYYGARLFILGGLEASLSWQLCVYPDIRDRLPFLNTAPGEILWMVLTFAVMTALVFLMEAPNLPLNPGLAITPMTAGTTAAMAFFIYVLSSLSFASADTPFSGTTYAEAFNIRTLTYMAGAAVLYAGHVQLCQTHERLEKSILEQTLAMQRRTYELERDSVELVNRKYHDLKHQIAVLRTEIGAGKKLEYLDRMEKEIAVYESLNRTGNEVLDTVLAGKVIRCQQAGIQLTCVADGACLSFMDLADVSVLFGNAIDNAIEAARKVASPEERLVHVSVSRHGGFVRILVENRYDGSLRRGSGEGVFLTTKKDALNHGYGMKSIRRTAERYGGSVTTKADGTWFELRILIPAELPEEPAKRE